MWLGKVLGLIIGVQLEEIHPFLGLPSGPSLNHKMSAVGNNLQASAHPCPNYSGSHLEALIEEDNAANCAIFGPHVPKIGFLDKEPAISPFPAKNIRAEVTTSNATSPSKTSTEITTRLSRTR